MMGLRGRADPRLGAMRSDIAESAWPPITDSRTAVLAALVHQLDRSQWLSCDEIASRQRVQLTALLTYHASHSLGFAARLTAAGVTTNDLCQPGGLVRIPALSRIEVQGFAANFDDKDLPVKHQPVTSANTSGSTGEPVRVWRTALNRLHWLALTVRYHLWAEHEIPARLAIIRANVKTFGPRADWGVPMGLLWNSGPALLIDIENDINRQIDLLADFAPDSVIIYPTNLLSLLDTMEQRGESLPTVRLWRTLGETVTADARERISEGHAALLSDCYSTEELGYLAMQCPDQPDTYHIVNETVLIELVDDEGQPVTHGTVGKVLVTDLHNLAAPMIRYAVGDHAVAGDPCVCGRGGPTLSRIMGRTRNMIVKPDGTRHWPLLGYKQYRDIAPIRQYQMIQHKLEQLEMRLVTERPLTDAEEAAMTTHLQAKLRHPFAVTYSYFDGRLPVGKNGKFEEFLCLL